MAIRPDYTIGTITLTSGNVNFTTSGSSLQLAGVQAGDAIITRSGDVLIIATVTGQNAGTLFQPCPASAAGTAQPLRIRFQPDGSRYQAAARDLIARWGQSGNVDALAGLSSAANTLPYFTGAGTASTTGLTAWARTLLAAANGGAAYGVLGAVPNGQLPGRLRESAISINNLDTISETGFYWSVGGAVGIPVSGNYYVLHQQGSSDDFASQEAILAGGTEYRKFSRKKRGGVWEDWYSTGLSILGNVSQSGGEPTGAIIQRGSNANGEFVRFADGTQICWFVSPTQYTTNTASAAGVCYSVFPSMAFPAPFSTPPVLSGSSIRINGFQSWITFLMPSNTATSAGTLWSAHTIAEASPGYMAIGRWF